MRFEIKEDDIDSYYRAADFLNNNNVEIVCLQFEYGIFGGASGSYILPLLRDLRMPVVTTLHTILKNPSEDQRKVIEQVISLSDRIIVMSQNGIELLKTVYGIQSIKIDYIGHGIPDLPFADSSFHKSQFGVEGKTVILSFGLISPNKGLEFVISALPEIINKHPNTVYIILGATHPHVVRNEGETYRTRLEELAKKLKIENNLIFFNKFVNIEELLEFIGITDIYITPYLESTQIVSGTLAYMLGAGKAIISTPYYYAEEMLAEERGILVPFQNSDQIAIEVNTLLDHEAKRHEIRKNAYLFGRSMIWSKTAVQYMDSFEKAKEERRYFSELGFDRPLPIGIRFGYPKLKLDHLRHLTDQTGMIQHAYFTLPNYNEGYSTDDNARAVIVCTLLMEQGNDEVIDLAYRYLAYLWYSYNPSTKRFRNFMDYQRNWLEESGSEDCHGRSLLALGIVLSKTNEPKLPSIAGRLFEEALPTILNTSSPRSWAFAILAINEYLKRFDGDRRAEQVRDKLSHQLMNLYKENHSDDWLWYEKSLSYCNGVLPHALLVTAVATQNDDMKAIALTSLNWLGDLQTSGLEGGHFVPIGSNGFFSKGCSQARFDQQPVEAQVMISVYLEAYRVTNDSSWKTKAIQAFEWFLGRNDLNTSLYDPTTGGCRDGLHSDRINENQGAESTLAFLQSLLEIRTIDQTKNERIKL